MINTFTHKVSSFITHLTHLYNHVCGGTNCNIEQLHAEDRGNVIHLARLDSVLNGFEEISRARFDRNMIKKLIYLLSLN